MSGGRLATLRFFGVVSTKFRERQFAIGIEQQRQQDRLLLERRATRSARITRVTNSTALLRLYSTLSQSVEAVSPPEVAALNVSSYDRLR